MKRALPAYLASLHRRGDPLEAALAAAAAVADEPWDVVRAAGLLARCQVVRADSDLGLTERLDVRAVRGRGVIAVVQAGALYPTLAHPRRRSRGTFDTPTEMARRVVASALGAAAIPVQTALDPACGAGAFLLALAEAGVPEVCGADIDPVALAVASVAVPRAKLELRDASLPGELVDVVVGNPPFVRPERQERALREELGRRFPWLHGRYDLAIPFAAAAVDRARPGGAAGLVLPAAVLVQPYGEVLRRRWLEQHRVIEIGGPWPFPGASVDVMALVMQIGAGRSALPGGVDADEVLRLPGCPIDPGLLPGDVALVERIQSLSRPLGASCVVDTGVVAHGPRGGKEALLYDEPGEGRVPYADARDFFAGRRRWLQYAPDLMHRAKSQQLMEGEKLVIQRIRGNLPVRAAIDRAGVYVGHTCTVVRPGAAAAPLELLLELVRSPLVDGVLRIERGRRLDLYPHDVAAFPVPLAWLDAPDTSLEDAWGLSEAEIGRLKQAACR